MDPLRKRRAFGQHFLRDTSLANAVAQRALEQARIDGARTLLEIGPGEGALTRPALEELRRLPEPKPRIVICERDRDLVARWESFEPPSGLRMEVIGGDFLEIPESRWANEPPILVLSNLPYSTGTAILIRLAAKRDEIPSMILMFQAEVAQRIRAEPGTKDWGSLSVWIQNRWDVRKLFSVKPGSFSPPPKVHSEVVLLRRREEPRISVPDETLWNELLRACFAHRRKMLRSGLPRVGPLRNALEVSGLDGTRRAETLNWDDWRNLYQAFVLQSAKRD